MNRDKCITPTLSQHDPAESSATASTGPMVHIASSWKEKLPINDRDFSNGEEVTILLCGTSLGRQQPTDGKGGALHISASAQMCAAPRCCTTFSNS